MDAMLDPLIEEAVLQSQGTPRFSVSAPAISRERFYGTLTRRWRRHLANHQKSRGISGISSISSTDSRSSASFGRRCIRRCRPIRDWRPAIADRRTTTKLRQKRPQTSR
jgi:hypothetical protein